MKKTLSLVIPVYNEASRIGKCFAALKNWTPPSTISLERIIFVNDGSIDTSKVKILKSKRAIENHLKTTVDIISYKKNRGKGYAVTRGMEKSTSEYTLFVDADMSTPISELSNLLPAMKKRVEVIVGTRKNGKSTVIRHQPVYRELLGHAFTQLTNGLFGLHATDYTCGFKAFRLPAKDAIFSTLVAKRWSFDAETIWRAQILGYTVREVPVIWSDVRGSKVSLWTDIPKTLIELVRARLTSLSRVEIRPNQQVWVTIET